MSYKNGANSASKAETKNDAPKLDTRSKSNKDLQNMYLAPVPKGKTNGYTNGNTKNNSTNPDTNNGAPTTNGKNATDSKIPSNFNVQLPALDTLLKAPKVKLKAVHQYADNALPPQHGFAEPPKEAVGAVIEEKLVEGIVDSETAPTNIECDCDVCVLKKGGKPKVVTKKAPLPPLKLLPPEKVPLPDEQQRNNQNGGVINNNQTTTTTTTTTIVKAGEEKVDDCNCPECQARKNPQNCPICNPAYGGCPDCSMYGSHMCPICTQYSYHLGYAGYGYPPYGSGGYGGAGYGDGYENGNYSSNFYNKNNANKLKSIEPRIQTDRSGYGKTNLKMIEAQPNDGFGFVQSTTRVAPLIPTERSLYADYEDGRPRFHTHHKISHLRTSDPELDRVHSGQFIDKDRIRPLWNPSNVPDRNNPTRLDMLDTLRLKQNINGLSPRDRLNGSQLGNERVMDQGALVPFQKSNSLKHIKTTRVNVSPKVTKTTTKTTTSTTNPIVLTNGTNGYGNGKIQNQVEAPGGSNKKQTVILINPT